MDRLVMVLCFCVFGGLVAAGLMLSVELGSLYGFMSGIGVAMVVAIAVSMEFLIRGGERVLVFVESSVGSRAGLVKVSYIDRSKQSYWSLDMGNARISRFLREKQIIL